MLNFEKKLKNYKNLEYICGCDEAGRGPSAGPLYAACVIMSKDYINHDINDSKKLSIKKREHLYNEIIKNALDYFIIKKDALFVDKYNPKASSKIAMKEAILALKIKPDLVISDYEKIDLDINQINLIKGDEQAFSVACASILAKVSRDKEMLEIAKKYPGYDFENNKGYFTKKHKLGIEKLGLCKEHRLSYKNIKAYIKK
ncbi:ribonuclease HII [Mycoplasma struthionis]|uniref:Ribonuclease n=1 Tax=Mycoplasma struthionis TaxID=538220 RepID=A0A3G8LHR2_9MOLU|nr:ribonuclease HII [Mycoplasma struthionis]AZG68400.1 ribonuclease HII [Mycoplasma struthionis]